MQPLKFIIVKKQSVLLTNTNNELNALLYQFRNVHAIIPFIEIIDCSKYKILKKRHLVEQVLHQPQLKAFQFIMHLN